MRYREVLTVAVLLLTAGFARAENLYGTTENNILDSPDRHAHPRSVKDYRRFVPESFDMYGMCRNAGHPDQCIWRLNGHQYPPPDKITKALAPMR